MKRTVSFTLAIALLAMLGFVMTDSAFAQARENASGRNAQHQYGPFDQDGDGIPNGLDPDFVKPLDGSGKQLGKLNRGVRGTGICSGSRYGVRGIGPRDGSGLGTGSGTCDGTGPKGKMGPRK